MLVTLQNKSPSTIKVLQLSPAKQRVPFPSSAPARLKFQSIFLRDEQLKVVIACIFYSSLSQSFVQTCLKSVTIIQVPKKLNPACMNNLHAVDLTPIALTP
ncbi:uncharacterized protein LOC121632933 [Tachysurus ichikawai]